MLAESLQRCNTLGQEGRALRRKGLSPLVFLTSCLMAVLPADLCAWGPKGHRVVAALAESRLSPDVRAEARELAGEDGLVGIANWADDIRRERPETAPWHYVNIPKGATAYDPRRDCMTPRDGDCVVAAIEHFRSVLSDANHDRDTRAEALRFLTHFVADVHQPLHCLGELRGGNLLEVNFLGESTNPFNERPWNLHAVWDSGLLFRSGIDEASLVARLEGRLNAEPAHRGRHDSPRQWAIESHRAAVEQALKLPDDHRIDIFYVRLSLPVIEERLASAGLRLAHLLTEALRTDHK